MNQMHICGYLESFVQLDGDGWFLSSVSVKVIAQSRTDGLSPCRI